MVRSKNTILTIIFGHLSADVCVDVLVLSKVVIDMHMVRCCLDLDRWLVRNDKWVINCSGIEK